jgi:hypothetical protein
MFKVWGKEWIFLTQTSGDESPGVVQANGSVITQPSQIPSVTQRLHGLVSSQRIRLFLQAPHAAAALLPDATLFAVRMAFTKERLSLRAIIGTVLYV